MASERFAGRKGQIANFGASPWGGFAKAACSVINQPLLGMFANDAGINMQNTKFTLPAGTLPSCLVLIT